MKSGIPIEQGSLVLVPFPFTDLRTVKRRPVLVLSHDAFNKTQEDVIVCQITSKIKKDLYSVFLTQKDMEKGELKVASRIKPYHIVTLDKQLIEKNIGKVSKEMFEKVQKIVVSLLSWKHKNDGS